MKQRSTFTVDAPSNPLERVLALVKAFYEAPGGADITVRAGRSADGNEPAVCVSVDDKNFIVTAYEARRVVALAEESRRLYPGADDGFVGSMVRALTAGADRAEQQ